MIKNLLNATNDNPYSPDGTFNMMYLLDKGISNSENSALWSRVKAFLFPKTFGTFQIENLFCNVWVIIQ